MTVARRGAVIAALLAAILGASWWIIARQPSGTQASRPELMLLTSLPIVFGEGFDPRQQGSPVLKALSERFTVRPISTSSKTDLAKGRLLLMAQPPPQTPENLVALDAWVRSGGRLLLLADPMLEWPSERALGDPLRPPVMFTDTGLLAHWGLRLDAPDRRGPVSMGGDAPAIFMSPGRIVSSNSACSMSREAIEAVCRIGAGRAVIIADADLLNADLVSAGDTRRNLAALIEELERLRVPDSQRTDLSTRGSARTS